MTRRPTNSPLTDTLCPYTTLFRSKPVIVALNKIDTLDDELIAALSAELEAESGHPVMALSGASGAGAPAVLDKLLEAIGHPEPGADEGDEASGWSPV